MLLRLASFNVESLDDGPDAPDFESRRAVLAPQLRRLAADVLCLQEVDGQRLGPAWHRHGPRGLRALDRLLAGTDYASFHRFCTHVEGGGIRDRHNLVVLSRFPIVAARQHHHDLVPPPLYRPVTADPPMAEVQPVAWDRPLLAVTVDIGGGRKLHVVDLHLRAPRAAPVAGQKVAGQKVAGRKSDEARWRTMAGWAEGYFLAAVKRSGQALEARLAIDSLFDADPRALIAVCGDFNAVGNEMPLRILCGDVEDAGDAALSSRCLTPLEQGVDAARRFSVLHRGQPQMLDHILVSPALLAAFRSLEIHNEGLQDDSSSTAALTGGPQSFHAPLVGTFEMA